MREWIGTCHSCGTDIYCENGFFNGTVLPGHQYLCFECESEETEWNEGETNK